MRSAKSVACVCVCVSLVGGLANLGATSNDNNKQFGLDNVVVHIIMKLTATCGRKRERERVMDPASDFTSDAS